MTEFLSFMGTIATTMTGVAGDFVGIVVAQPILLAPIAVGIIYGGIRAIKSFL